MNTSSSAHVEILAPTLFEYLITRSVRPSVPVRHVGMRLARWCVDTHDSLFIVCGLAGGLTNDLHPGDVVIPDDASLDGEPATAMDVDLVTALRASAHSLGFVPHHGRLLTASNLVTSDDRGLWADRGFIAADMEAALLPERCRFAVIRVILDTPHRSISSEWTNVSGVAVSRLRWRELLWMTRDAPVFARRAARIASITARNLARTNSV